jgi:hypothetical protein
MKVSFSTEELKTFRDCVERKVQDLKRSRESYAGKVGELLDEAIEENTALHQRLVGLVVLAAEEDKVHV